MQTNVVLLQCQTSISVHQTLSTFQFMFPGWKSLCDRSSRFLTFQRAHVTETSVDRTDATTFRRVRSWTTHAGNQTTNGRVMRMPSGVRQDVSTSKKSFNYGIPCFSSPTFGARGTAGSQRSPNAEWLRGVGEVQCCLEQGNDRCC